MVSATMWTALSRFSTIPLLPTGMGIRSLSFQLLLQLVPLLPLRLLVQPAGIGRPARRLWRPCSREEPTPGTWRGMFSPFPNTA